MAGRDWITRPAAERAVLEAAGWLVERRVAIGRFCPRTGARFPGKPETALVLSRARHLGEAAAAAADGPTDQVRGFIRPTAIQIEPEAA